MPRDPRIPFALLLTLYGVLGFTFLGFNRSPAQMALVVGVACALDVFLSRAVRGRWVFPLSAWISGASLALLLNYSHGSAALLFPVWLAISSKYVLTHRGRHVFNPSLFGISVALFASGELVTAAPAYQWAGGAVTMSAFVAMAAMVLFVARIGRGVLIVSFLVLYAAQTAFRAWYLRHHLPPEVLFLGSLTSPPFFLFVFYMLTDPATSPKTPRGQFLFALALVIVDLWLHTKESVYTFFYAAFLLQAAKLVFLHARDLVRGEYSSRPSSAWVPVAAAGLLFLGIARARAAPVAEAAAGRLVFGEVPVEHHGIESEMGDVFAEVDPRVQHIAKWVLAVGDAVALGDVDGDGAMDLLHTAPLGTADTRVSLWRNLGELAFERVEVAAFDYFAGPAARSGIPAGATLADWDGDGDTDLALAVGFGRSRLYENASDGEWTDVSDAAGLREHTVSLAIDFLDYDRDGALDMLVTNAMTPYLPDYEEPTPFNLFDLPQPAHPGDRRMFRFMHDGWHDAANGGPNHLYRNDGDGHFELQDGESMGLTETRWSLSVATGDLNRDGWTDFYVANDFGPDRLYLNRAGHGFESVVGRMFGDVGKDTYKGMNSTVADIDNDGWLDVYVSNVHHALQAEGSLLWRVRPSEDPFVPDFSDEATARGALNERRFGWGAAAADLDADGWLDLVQANGMVDDRLDPLLDGRKDYWYVNHKLMQSGPEVHTYADKWGDIRGRTLYPNEARRLYRNLGERAPGCFVDVAAQVGIDAPDNSRGVAVADLDNDGDLDMVITNQHGPLSLYENRLDSPAFLGLELVGNGAQTSASAIGTRVRIEGGATREVTALNGFAAQGDPRLYFGLGRVPKGTVRVTVDWLGGVSQTLRLESHRYHRIVQPSSP